MNGLPPQGRKSNDEYIDFNREISIKELVPRGGPLRKKFGHQA